METKVFELRDNATFIPILAVRLSPANERERYLLARSGYGLRPEDQRSYVQLAEINGGRGHSTCDPYDWDRGRTIHVAHQYIIDHWDELPTGSVVDVRFILSEQAEPSAPEGQEGDIP